MSILLRSSQQICDPVRERAQVAFREYERAVRDAEKALHECLDPDNVSDDALQQLKKAHSVESSALDEYMQALRDLHEHLCAARKAEC